MTLLVSTLTLVLALLPASSACSTSVLQSRHLLVEAALQRADLILQLGDIALHFLLFLAGRKARARNQQE